MFHITADWALLDDGFSRDVRISIDAQGFITAVQPGDPGGNTIAGAVLPGMTNLHSHAFQRSFAGRAEFTGGGGDFWSWREAMYRAAGRVEPENLSAITAYLAMRLLQGGYTSLVEFHYLHHAANGAPYANRAALADAVIAGAARAGIGLTLLYGIYETAGFGVADLRQGQIRFRNTPEDALGMLQTARARASADLRFGLAPHSLRAVPPSSLRRAVEGLAAIDPTAPIHIHLAEQTAEVTDCLAALGATPVAWLLDHVDVGPHWCLIHATHTTPAELTAIAARHAVVGLCPTTEANLGDGIFNLAGLTGAGGGFGVGSDSNVGTDAFAELRQLEYSQRLALRRRNLGAGGSANTGLSLWRGAAAGGAQASGRNVGRIAPGHRADIVVIGPAPEVADLPPNFWLDAAVFTATQPAVDVMQGGRWLVQGGVHRDEAAITQAYQVALAQLA